MTNYTTPALGDAITPITIWNDIWPKDSIYRLAKKVEILDIAYDQPCQNGILVKVESVSGITHWIDAGWFEEYNEWKENLSIESKNN